MSTREIVTLQVGHYSNSVGTHWWNLQEGGFNYDEQAATDNPSEINHDVLFREGKNLRGEVTYTPRLVSIDLKGSLKSLKQHGVLYDVPPAHESRQRDMAEVTVHRAAPIQKNEFLTDLDQQEHERLQASGEQTEQMDATVSMDTSHNTQASSNSQGTNIFGPKFYNLDKTVTVWSDYLRLHLHPRSIILLPTYHHDSDDELFDIYTHGMSALNECDTLNDVEHRLHFFTEECDSLQGLHTIVDTYNGFGGVASRLLETLADDFSGKSLLTFSVTPPNHKDTSRATSVKHLINTALSVESLSRYSSLLVPLSLSTQLYTTNHSTTLFPHLNYNRDLNYHTSAILAAAVDTATLPYRLKSSPCYLSHITDAFNTHSRKIACLSSCFPLPISPNTTLMDTLLSYESAVPWQPLTPYMDHRVDPTHQSVVVRGHLPSPSTQSNQQSRQIFNSNNEVLQQYLTESYPTTLNGGCMVRDACSVKSPFPHIFSPKIDQHGCLQSYDRPSLQGVNEVSMMTSLQSNNSISQLLHHLHNNTTHTNLKKQHHYLTSTFEEDDFKEAISRLESLAENYED